MSDFIGHKCGVVLLRLKRPLEEVRARHGDMLWGMRRLYLLMEKQRNRGHRRGTLGFGHGARRGW